MTRIDAIPLFPTLDTDAVAPAAARKSEEPGGKEAFAEIFAGLAIQPPGATAATPLANPLASPAPGKDPSANGVALQKVELSPSMRLIMPAAAPMPDAASLHAFARLQGLDESAIQQLFGAPTATPITEGTGNALPNALLGDSIAKATQASAPGVASASGAAAATLAAPMIMGLGLEGAAGMASTPRAEPDPTIPPAGNVLSVSIQRLLTASAGAVSEAGQAAPSSSAMGDEIEVISLDLSTTDDLAPDTQDPADLTGSLDPASPTDAVDSADGPSTDVLKIPLGTWDELRTGAPLVSPSMAGATKGPRGQTLLAADLMPTLANGADDALQPTGTTPATDASGAGAHGHSTGGWTGTGTGQSGMAVPAYALNTGDVSASRQLSEQLAQRMGEQIAQRLMNKLAQGEWQFKFVLNPKNMGEIQVNLRMHAGSLDGTFVASQTATRDMLGDGLQRLKDVLQNAGMNVANFDVGADHSSRQGRQAMTSGQSAPTLALQGLQQVSPAASPVQTTGSRGGDLGWDVLV